MLQLIAPNGTVLDLNPDTVVQLNLKNPVFNIDQMEGSYSFAFPLPLTDRNRAYFGYPDQVGSLSGLVTEFEGFRLKYNLIELACKLTVRSVSDTAISVNLFTASAQFAETLRTTTINEVPTQVVNISTEFWYGKYEFLDDPGTVGEIAVGTLLWRIDGGGTATYKYGAKFQGSVSQLVKDMAAYINANRPIPAYSGSTTYQTDELVTSGGNVYRSGADANVGHPVTDTDWWELVCSVTDWPATRQDQGTPLWYAYDEFGLTKRERAFAQDNAIIIYDQQKGAGRYLDINSFNQPDDITAAGYFTVAEYAADGVNVWQDNYTALAGYATKLIRDGETSPSHIFFPIHNPAFSPNKEWCGVVNYWKEGSFRGNVLKVSPYRYGFSAQVNLVYTLRKLHEFLGNTIDEEEVLTDVFLTTLYLMSNYSNDRNIRTSTPTGTFTIDAGANLLDISQNLPVISLGDFLNGIRGYFFLGIWFDWFTGKVVYRKLSTLLTSFSDAVDLTDQPHTIRDLSYTNPKGFSLEYTHDGGDGYINEYLRDIYADDLTRIADVATFDDLPLDPEENEICLVLDEDAYYIAVLLFEGVIEWQYYSKNLYGLELGEALTRYQPKCATPMMYRGHDYDRGPREIPLLFERGVDNTYREGDFVQDDEGNFYEALADNTDVPLSDTSKWATRTRYDWQVPMTYQARRSKNFKEKQSASLRLLSYLGLATNPVSGTSGDEYPQATNDRGTLGSLKWEGEHGLYEKWGKEWIQFLSTTKKVSVQVPMDEELFNQIRPWRLIRIRNQYFVLGEIKVNFPLSTSISDLTLYRIHQPL